MTILKREGNDQVIARLWHGWTTPANADGYEKLLLSEILPGIRRIKGYHGAFLLRKDGGRKSNS